MFQKCVVSSKARDCESGQAVAEAALEDEAAREGGGRGESDFEGRRAASGLEHLARREWSISLADHTVVMRGVAHAEVQEVAAERLDASARVHLDGLVDVRARPAPFRAAVEAELIVRVPTAASNPSVHVARAARYPVAVGEARFVGFAQGHDARAKLVGDALVGVKTEYPIVLRGLGGELLLHSETRPVSFDDARIASKRDLPRAVGRARVNDDNLVSPRDRLARGADVVRFVECDYGRGYLQNG